MIHQDLDNAPFHLDDAEQVVEATDLIMLFGAHAPVEAAIRAGHMRDIGNVVHFCRWRQTARLIALLTREEAVGTVH
ncbi:hypothetical protein SFC76_10880 [Sphingomonas sp. CD22]|uniref:hypothetical protein n=1 Tax=Sphingomonas sp. CD22 TaxID=3100214 RepID=UPI002ADFABF9|nr:hypothetical protein [Sphingomonas sp. CD22]MEA1084765.1 hypothetical protein [Sphingomonas sp. CD22]